jgi:dipeptidyl aminopeptidase/acylaminoacyl peptidase
MRDPDWIGLAPERPYWSEDGAAVFYFQKRLGEDSRDLVRLDLASGQAAIVPDSVRGTVDQPGGIYNRDHTMKVWSHHGDLFLRELPGGPIRQLTRTAEPETDPRFMADQRRICFRRASNLVVRDPATGEESQPAELRAEKDPLAKKEEKGYLAEQQPRLFDTLRENKEKREHAQRRERQEHAADPTRVPPPWYLGDDVEIRETVLSPAGDWLVVRLGKKDKKDGRADKMPAYVTDDGYVSTRDVRAKVGTATRTGDELILLDLRAPRPLPAAERNGDGEAKPADEPGKHVLNLSVLPGIADDPLKELRDAAKQRAKEKDSEKKEAEQPAPEAEPGQPPEGEKQPDEKPAPDDEEMPKPRPVILRDILFTDDGSRLAIQCFSLDHKDRWIATVDLAGAEKKIVPQERMTDEAWIVHAFADLGWLRDNRTLWFLSEESGYSHLYLRDVESEESGRRRLTGLEEGSQAGRYEVSDVSLSRDGSRLFFSANRARPGIDEFFSIDVTAPDATPVLLSAPGGRNSFTLSPDESRLLILHSTTTHPPELYLQDSLPAPSPLHASTPSPQQPRGLTHTTSDEFAAIDWVAPEVLPIPGREGRQIWSRLYSTMPSRLNTSTPSPPAIVFIHGAGYLQNAHEGWSQYFREFMFHTLLVRRGYLVLDMDYRASAGYGREWRTAVYRNMGAPELDDLEDGVAWLIRERNVNPARIGVYGGSYGGFLTLMAMFTRPDLFACAAALRPVTDWAHYSDPYTANILNTPELDPEAYQRSSPIEHAAGLKGRLLICHGMLDDNVLFQDTVRLAQRLIELKKENWEVAIYPVEAHAFKEPTSWLDEYRRILQLFEEALR